ncbi:MAG TPA: butyryl-CoA dehydrogenase, partial [Chloroflexi bacterium]|nr:butyryl-CoA dehydrogenase [Chloroflexota bacterium]
AIDTSHQVSLTVHLALAAMCMFQWGSEAQRDQWLPALARGERIGTFGLTEPGAGSDVGALRMRAHRVPGGYEISGEKSWISATNQATLFILFATIDPA